MFKPGDRVVRTGPTATWKGERCVHGETYTVDQVTEAGNLGLEGLPGSWTGRYFTLAWRDGPAPSPVDPEAWDPFWLEKCRDVPAERNQGAAFFSLVLLGFLRHFRVAYGTRPRVELPEPWQPMETCPERGTVLLANTHGQVFIWSVRAILPQHHVIAWTPAPPHPYKGGEA